MSETSVSITGIDQTEALKQAHHSHSVESGHRPSVLRFAGHVVEMLVSMMAGMMVGMWLPSVATGLTVKEFVIRYPLLSLAIMAVSMTVPMAAWMRFRGHSVRSCIEMGASMLLPALPFIPLYWLGVVVAPGRPYMNISTAAMIALMIYRRREYGL